VLIFLRKGEKKDDQVLVICNFVPVPWHHYRIGVPSKGIWEERLNSDAITYGGSGQGNLGSVETTPNPIHGKDYSLSLTLPPLGILFLKFKGK